MDTVTYPDARVASFVKRHFVPVKVMVKEKPDVTADYQVNWTPNVVVSDETGKVHYRLEGFLPPEEFVAELSLGLGRYWFDRQEFDKAIRQFEQAAEQHRGEAAGAQALYWLGVAQYKQSQDPAQLHPSWRRLIQEYPDSEWAKRANVPKSS